MIVFVAKMEEVIVGHTIGIHFRSFTVCGVRP